MDSSTCMVRLISVKRGIVMALMSEDREVAPSKSRRLATARLKKALTPIVSASGSGPSSNSSMEWLLKGALL